MVTVNMLVNRATGKPFEVNVNVEGSGRATEVIDRSNFIAGFKGAGRCANCHGNTPGIDLANRGSGGVNSLPKVK